MKKFGLSLAIPSDEEEQEDVKMEGDSYHSQEYEESEAEDSQQESSQPPANSDLKESQSEEGEQDQKSDNFKFQCVEKPKFGKKFNLALEVDDEDDREEKTSQHSEKNSHHSEIDSQHSEKLVEDTPRQQPLDDGIQIEG